MAVNSKTKKKNAGKQNEKADMKNKSLIREMIGLFLMALGLFALLSVFTSVTGLLGAATADALFAIFGVLAYTVPLLLVVIGWLVMISFQKRIHGGKMAVVVTLGMLTVVLVHLFFHRAIQLAAPNAVTFGEYVSAASTLSKLDRTAVGFLGAALGWPFIELLGFWGSLILVLALMLGGVALLTRFSLGAAGRKVTDAAVGAAGRGMESFRERRKDRAERVYVVNSGSTGGARREFHNEKIQPPKNKKAEPEIFDIASGKTRGIGVNAHPLSASEEAERSPAAEEAVFESPEESEFDPYDEPSGVLNPIANPDDLDAMELSASSDADAEPFTIEAVEAQGIAHVSAKTERKDEAEETGDGGTATRSFTVLAGAEPLAGVVEIEDDPEEFAVDASSGVHLPYRFPPMSLLSAPSEPATQGRRAAQEQAERAQLLIDTLHSFGIEATVVGVSRGPALTRYEIKPASGVKVSRITGLADDIALNMAAVGVRIEAPIPGKAAVGIEIPNLEVSTVTLREVLECDDFRNHPSRLAFALGKDIAGKPIVADLARMPHVLIAGATGSGKSVCINSLVASILFKATPEEVKLIMIDPKVVELSVYNGIPHLLVPVVTDPKKAAGALNWAVMEMGDRYKKFADTGNRDLKGYNEYARTHDLDTLSQIVVIIDELADLMMVAPRDVEDHVCRLAQLARAAGIHLVIATQRPSVNVITGVIKANIPSRIAFAVASQVDSRTILDMAGAEKLLGRGDMLFDPSGANKAQRVQGCFIPDKEVNAVVDLIKQYREVEYDPDIIEQIERSEGGGGEGPAGFDEDDGVDELLAQAIETAIEAGQISTSMLQRKFRVGYARAGRLIDEMEKRGVITGFEGSKPRTTLIGREEYQRQFGNTEASE